jgi:hypothetical protein
MVRRLGVVVVMVVMVVMVAGCRLQVAGSVKKRKYASLLESYTSKIKIGLRISNFPLPSTPRPSSV